MKKLNAGVWGGMVIFLISLLFLLYSFQYDYKGELGPGPGFFPVWLSGILMVLSILYIFESVKGKNLSEELWPSGEAVRKILFILFSLVVFVAALALFGMIAASVVFLFLCFLKAYKWYSNLAISVGVSLFIFWLFNQVLGVPLPLTGMISL